MANSKRSVSDGWIRVPMGGVPDNPSAFTSIRDALRDLTEDIRKIQSSVPEITTPATAAPSSQSFGLSVATGGGVTGSSGVYTAGQNISITANGSASTISISGIIPVTNGGTGIAAYTIGDVLYANGATSLDRLAAVATGSVLVSAGVGTAPTWSSAVTLTTSLSAPTVTATTVFISGSGDGTDTTGEGSIRGADRVGTDLVGSNLTIRPGNGTGTGGSGAIVFSTSPVGVTGASANTITERMRVTAAGRVGIGTSSPTQALDVVGDTSGGHQARIYNANTAGRTIFTLDSDASGLVLYSYGSTYSSSGAQQALGGMLYASAAATGGLSIATSAAAPIRFYTGGISDSNERMRIQNNGLVGIGTTTPSSLLHISSAGSAIFTIEADTDNVTETDNARIILKQDGGLTNARIGYRDDNSIEVVQVENNPIVFRTTDTERMRILGTGNVGIDTTSPNATLSIGTNIGTFSGISIGGAADRDIRIGQASTNNLILAWRYNATAANAYGLIETLGGSNPLILQSAGGNVGIGAAPASGQKLDVQGIIATSGTSAVYKRSFVEAAPVSAVYRKIATLPISGSGTYDHIGLNVVCDDSYLAANKAEYRILMGNRGGFSYEWTSTGPVRTHSGIRAYQEANGSISVWTYHNASQYTTVTYSFEQALNSTIIVSPTTGTPTGTLVFNTSDPGTYMPMFTLLRSNQMGINTHTVRTWNASASSGANLAPTLEIATGTSVGTYTEGVVIRHANIDATAVTRELYLALKFSSESSSTESNKWVGLRGYSTNAFANSPALDLVVNGLSRVTVKPGGELDIIGSVLQLNGTSITNASRDLINIGAITATGAVTGASFNSITGLSSTTPSNIGTAAVGTATTAARADHVHAITGAALTKTDDTNVTLTLGGSASTALVNAASITAGWTGTLAVSRGGTGQSTYTDGQLLIGNTATTGLSKAALTAGSGITITNGNGTITITNASPSSGGTVTSVGMTVPSFLSVTPASITTSGTFAVTLATQSANTVFAGPTTGAAAAPTFRSLVLDDLPTITAVKGGTGLTSYTIGDLLYADSTTTLAKRAAVASGSVLASAGIGTAPTWSSAVTLSTSLSAPTITASAMLVVTGSANIPATTGSNVRIAGGYASPVIGRVFIGDGTGWKLNFSSRSGSVDTDRVTMTDTGRVGIGTDTPQTRLHLNSISGTLDTDLYNNTDTILAVNNGGTGVRLVSTTATPTTIENTPALVMLTGRGDATAATGLSSGDFIGRILWQGIESDGGRQSSAEIRAAADAASTATAVPGRLTFWTSDTTTVAERMRIDSAGDVGIGVTNPTALLHLAAGTTTRAPFKFTSGTNLTTAEAGAVEFDGTSLFITNSTPTRKTIAYTDSTITGNAANVTGTVAVANGGTGQTTYTDGQLLIGNTATTGLSKSTLTAGSGITITNGNGTITITNASPSSGGTVTSVAMTVPSFLSVTPPSITTSGTFAVTLATQAANNVFIAPNGTAGTPTFRALVAADIPNLDASKITSGTLTVSRGGTGISSYTIGDLLYADSTTTLAKRAAVAEGSVLVSKGTGTAPAWQTSIARTLPDTTATDAFVFNSTITKNSTTVATMIGLTVNSTLNTGASNANTTFDAFRINVTETAVTGVASRFFMRGFNGATEYFRMTTLGELTLGNNLNIANGYVYIYNRTNSTDTVFASKISTDTNSRFIVNTNGSLFWGPGGTSATDTNLYRASADNLKTDDNLLVVGSLQSTTQIATYVVGDSFFRTYINNNGTILFGSGSAAQDVNLYWNGSNILKTDDTFAAQNLQFPTTTARSVNARNLDQYFESDYTFTEKSTTGKPTISTAASYGSYTLIGRVCTLSGHLEFSAAGTAGNTNTFWVSLPVQPAVGTGRIFVGVCKFEQLVNAPASLITYNMICQIEWQSTEFILKFMRQSLQGAAVYNYVDLEHRTIGTSTKLDFFISYIV